MKRVFDICIGIIMPILALVGLLLIIGGLATLEKDGSGKLVLGIVCLVSEIFFIGFSYIVDAAYIYIDNNDKKK